MGLFDRFRRPKQTGDSVPDDDGQPESMFEKVGDPQIEGGVPDVQSASGASKSPQQLMLLGAAVVGCGLAIAGLMIWINSAPSEEETEEKEVPEISADSQYDMAADQTRLLAEQQQEADASAPEGVESEEEENPPASTPEGVTAEGQSETRTAEASAPEPPPKDRRLTGEVLVAADSGGTSSAQSGASADGDAGNTAAIGVNDPYMSDNPPAEGGQAQSVGLAGRLNPTFTASVQATRRASSDYLLAKGTNIPCAVQNKIVTTQPGFTRCIVEKDVYSVNGKVLLLERGSKVTGEQASALLQGQARVFVLWNEAETPYGVRVALASPAAGQLGEAGIGARVNYHFWRRFGGAVMISLIGDLGDYAANRRNNKGNGQTFNFDNTSESAQDMATEALKNSINIPPTGYVNQGSRINIIVARDVDFGNVYERVSPYRIPLPDAGDTAIRQ